MPAHTLSPRCHRSPSLSHGDTHDNTHTATHHRHAAPTSPQAPPRSSTFAQNSRPKTQTHVPTEYAHARNKITCNSEIFLRMKLLKHFGRKITASKCRRKWALSHPDTDHRTLDNGAAVPRGRELQALPGQAGQEGAAGGPGPHPNPSTSPDPRSLPRALAGPPSSARQKPRWAQEQTPTPRQLGTEGQPVPGLPSTGASLSPSTHPEPAPCLRPSPTTAPAQCPAHAPASCVSRPWLFQVALGQVSGIVTSRPRGADVSWPSATAPLATRLRVADGRAAGHVLGMRWKAGCPQRPGPCLGASHLAAGTASGGAGHGGWHSPPSQELPPGPSTRNPRMAKSIHQARNHFCSCPRRGRED